MLYQGSFYLSKSKLTASIAAKILIYGRKSKLLEKAHLEIDYAFAHPRSYKHTQTHISQFSHIQSFFLS